MKKINDNTLFYILSSVISLIAVAFIVLICSKSFDSHVFTEKNTYSEYSETVAETEENQVSNEKTVTDKFFGVDIIYID